MRRVLALSLLACVLGAQEAPLGFFREPDRRTRRHIEKDLISNKGLGAAQPDARAVGRDRLVEIGAWSVPFLAAAIHGRKAEKDARVRMNAVIAASRIGDPRVLPALRGAARDDKNLFVRRVATLAVGAFRRPEDATLLQELLDPRRKDRRAAVFALAKLGVPPPLDGGRLKDRHLLAAHLLADAVVRPAPDAHRFLDHRDKLVRRAAAVALRLRPHGDHVEALLAALRKENDPRVAALQVHALGAVVARTDRVREALVDGLRHDDTEVRLAAAIELGARGRASDYDALRRAYRAPRFSATVAAVMPALLATGEPKAVDDLLAARGDKKRFYAAGALLHHLAFTTPESKRYQEIARAVAGWLDATDPREGVLHTLANELKYGEDKPALRAERARDAFAKVADPWGLRLWDHGPDDRSWAIVDDLLLRIFELDDLAAFGNPDNQKVDSPLPNANTGPDRGKAPAVSPDEQDLAAFLEPGYFRAEDLVRGG